MTISLVFQSVAHLKLKEILKNIIIRVFAVLLFYSETFSFFFLSFRANFFLSFSFNNLDGQKEKKNLKIKFICEKAYARQTRSQHYLFRISPSLLPLVSHPPSSKAGHWRQVEKHLLNACVVLVYDCASSGSVCWYTHSTSPSDMNINIASFCLNVLITYRLMHV